MKTRIASWEWDTIKAIAKRAAALAHLYGDKNITEQDILLDVSAAYAGGCRLQLDRLLAARSVDFQHDVFGIHNNLNRRTYQLENYFTPRYAVPR